MLLLLGERRMEECRTHCSSSGYVIPPALRNPVAPRENTAPVTVGISIAGRGSPGAEEEVSAMLGDGTPVVQDRCSHALPPAPGPGESRA